MNHLKNRLFAAVMLLGITAASQTFALRSGLALSSYGAMHRTAAYPGYTPPHK